MSDSADQNRDWFFAGFDAGWSQSGEGCNGEYCRCPDGVYTRARQDAYIAAVTPTDPDDALRAAGTLAKILRGVVGDHALSDVEAIRIAVRAYELGARP